MEVNNVKIDKYGSLIIETPKPNNVVSNVKKSNKFSLSFVYPDSDVLLSKRSDEIRKPEFVMSNIYFIYNCKRNKDGSRNLTLNGKDLYLRIGRRFKNWDVPYLTLFLLKNKDVTTLNLANNEICSVGFMNLIECIITCDHVIELDLQNNEIGDAGINYMYRNGTQLKLRVLRLSGNKIGVENLKKIAMMIARNAYIQHLDIAEVDQSEASLIYFTTVLQSNQTFFNKTLKILDLSRPICQCFYSKFNSSHIAAAIGSMLRYNASLEELHLQKFSFSCHDIEEMFENAKYNGTLRVLDLCCNNIGDYAAELFGNWLKKRPPLRSLLLSHNIITDHGIRLLSRGIRLSKLVVIDVSYNRFTDASGLELLNSLKKSPLVQQLRVYGNNIGHPMAKVIERMLLSSVLDQENIDVKPYNVDGIFYLAYYHKKDSK